MRLAVGLLGAADWSDIERGMRPGGLRQILDDTGDPVVAFDQAHVAGFDHPAQMLRIARRERLIARYLLLKVAGNQLADRVEHDAHDAVPPKRPFPAAFSLP